MTKTIEIQMTRAELAKLLSEHLVIPLDEKNIMKFDERQEIFIIKTTTNEKVGH